MSRAPIRRLDPVTAGQIRAGEVVERPVSALKELLENSIDAGAARIEVSVRGGLERELEVSDDGTGIPREELGLALETHSTSKIVDLEDLSRLATLGFRGEALPAIARASRLTIDTRAAGEPEGTSLESEGGEAGEARPSGRPPGTTVRVRDLFFNVPARRKFLRSSAGELRGAARLLSAYAIAYPEIAFRFVVDGRERLDAPRARTVSERLAAIFGRRFLDQCLPAADERPGATLAAFLGIPELARVTREAQVFLVNRRWVQSPLLSQAVRHAYGNLIPPGRHPACVVDLRLDPATVDVNVHPTKREVRFSHEDSVFSFVSRAAAVPLARLVPRYEAGSTATRGDLPSLHDLVRDASGQLPIWGKGSASHGGASVTGADPAGLRQASGPTAPSWVPRASARVGPAEILGDRDAFRNAALTTAEPPSEVAAPMEGGASATEEGASSSAAAQAVVRPQFANLWQLHDTYILAPISGGLVIVDQHAAHERILYEEALTRMRERSGAAQQLLFPLIVDLTRAEFELLLEILEPLGGLGFDVAPISPPSVLLRGVPPGLGGKDPGSLLRDLLDSIGEESGGRHLPDDELADRLAKSFACHAAVRSGDSLNVEEMNHLVDRLFATSLPHGDPHGRPSFVRVDLRELHARFGRGSP